MPKGPRGEKRPADVIGAAVKVMRIATGEEEDTPRQTAVTTRRRCLWANEAGPPALRV